VTRAERDGIRRAIAAAEEGTTGRIAVRVIPDGAVEAFERAKAEFGRVGLHRHGARNGALILVAPKARRFAIVGDAALHERVGDEFWNGVVRDATPYFAGGRNADAIVFAVGRIGDALHAHFASATT